MTATSGRRCGTLIAIVNGYIFYKDNTHWISVINQSTKDAWFDRLDPRIRKQARWQLREGDLYQQLGNKQKANEHWNAAMVALSQIPESRRYAPANRETQRELEQRLQTGG